MNAAPSDAAEASAPAAHAHQALVEQARDLAAHQDARTALGAEIRQIAAAHRAQTLAHRTLAALLEHVETNEARFLTEMKTAYGPQLPRAMATIRAHLRATGTAQVAGLLADSPELLAPLAAAPTTGLLRREPDTTLAREAAARAAPLLETIERDRPRLAAQLAETRTRLGLAPDTPAGAVLATSAIRTTELHDQHSAGERRAEALHQSQGTQRFESFFRQQPPEVQAAIREALPEQTTRLLDKVVQRPGHDR